MKITIIGCGRWGSFLAWYLDRIGHIVCLYGRESSGRFQELCGCRRNDMVVLRNDITLTCNLYQAVTDSEVLILAIESQQLREFMAGIPSPWLEDKTIVLCMKGLEDHTGKRLTQVVAEYAPMSARIAIWVGPGHVQDYIRGIPNCMVIDSEDENTKRALVQAFSSELIRFYYGTDLIGNELGAASKNVMGIAAGMLDGFGYASLKGALMARGTREISKLIHAMGGDPMSAYGLGHLGDYEATLFSPHSHNRRYGESFVRREPYNELAEGVSTVRALVRLEAEKQVDLPISHAVNAIIHEGKDPKDVLSNLFLRSIKSEFTPHR